MPLHPGRRAWAEGGSTAEALFRPSAGRLSRTLGQAVEIVCRAGYVARGFVYLSVGLMALLAALRLTPRAEGVLGALEAWADWPAGRLILWLTGAGLYGFAAWRLLQSVLDADGQGRSPKALAKRAGQALSGLAHAATAVGVFAVLDALEDLRELDDQAATRARISDILAAPGGELVLLGVGTFVAGAGVGNLLRAFGRPHRRLVCAPPMRRAAAALGRIGYGGRGVAFILLGLFLARSGLQARTSPAAGGLGGALEALKHGPLGAPLLAIVSIGLMAFGLFAFIEARCRRMGAAEAVEAVAQKAA